MPWDSRDLDHMFNPKVVAVIGSRHTDDYTWLRNMSDFKGKLYSVQIDPNDIAGIEKMGIPNYKSLLEVPDQVDYVVVAIPRRAVLPILKDAIAKGVKAIHMYTSGFAESGQEGAQLQQQITQLVRDAGVIVIGPNCMGVYSPEAGMRSGAGQEVGRSGTVAVISQSGAHNNTLIQAIQASGIAVGKGVSFGNAIVLDSPDLLDYFGRDPNTKIICAYIEGPKDGRRFFEALREASRHKPVILWKGGQTEAGQRSASSHTGSLAGSREVWDVVARQTGAIRVDSIQEAVDMVKALHYLPPTTGDRVGIIGGSGGQSVSMSDDFARAGLQVPVLSQGTLEAMSSFFQLIGASYYNPVDMGTMNRKSVESILDLLAADPNVDVIAVLVGGLMARGSIEDAKGNLALYKSAREKTGKPVLGMFWTPIPYRDGATLQDLDNAMQELGIPVFPSPERAARTLKKTADYYRDRQETARMAG